MVKVEATVTYAKDRDSINDESGGVVILNLTNNGDLASGKLQIKVSEVNGPHLEIESEKACEPIEPGGNEVLAFLVILKQGSRSGVTKLLFETSSTGKEKIDPVVVEVKANAEK